jgi:hypothetical protein
MSGITRQILPARSHAGLFLSLGLLAVLGVYWSRDRDGAMNAWEVEDLVSHLRQKGLTLRAVPTIEGGPLNCGAYLTTTDQSWERLAGLSANPELIGAWEGTVYCVRARVEQEGDARLSLWGECGLRIGPFLFFGDPGLLARIQAALRCPNVSGPFSRPKTLERYRPTASTH